MTGKTMTRILILTTAVIWISYDIWVYMAHGNAATISAQSFMWSTRAPGFSFLIGVLCGHLFFPQAKAVQELAAEMKTKEEG